MLTTDLLCVIAVADSNDDRLPDKIREIVFTHERSIRCLDESVGQRQECAETNVINVATTRTFGAAVRPTTS